MVALETTKLDDVTCMVEAKLGNDVVWSDFMNNEDQDITVGTVNQLIRARMEMDDHASMQSMVTYRVGNKIVKSTKTLVKKKGKH